MDMGNNKAAVAIVYFMCLFIIIGNLVQYWRIVVLSPSKGVLSEENGIYYGAAELRSIRSVCNKDPRLKCLPTNTIL